MKHKNNNNYSSRNPVYNIQCNIHIEAPHSGVQVTGTNSIQQQSVQKDKPSNAINGANVSEPEKKEAKGILVTLFQSKAVAEILGSAASGLLKLFGWV